MGRVLTALGLGFSGCSLDSGERGQVFSAWAASQKLESLESFKTYHAQVLCPQSPGLGHHVDSFRGVSNPSDLPS